MDWPTSALGICVILCFTRVWLIRMDAAQREAALAKIMALRAPRAPTVTEAHPKAGIAVYGKSCSCPACAAVRAAELGDDA